VGIDEEGRWVKWNENGLALTAFYMHLAGGQPPPPPLL